MHSIVFLFLALWLTSCAGLQSRYHRVEKGDSPQQIAAKYNITVADLQEYNEELKQGLKPGAKLYIPFESNPKWNQDPESVIAQAERDLSSIQSDGSASDVLSPKFKWPVRGHVSSTFGFRRGSPHEGIDIAAPRGTRVVASRSGHVIFSGSQISGYGNMVIIRHSDSYATVYAHLSKMNVRKGQFLSRGQLLGRVGSTGHATGPHLHFEVRNKRLPINPLQFLTGQYASN